MTTSILNNRLPLFVGVLLMVLAAVLSWVASGLFPDRFYEPVSFGVWFNADVPRIVDTLNHRHAEGHGIAYKHPIFSIILWPITQVFKLFSSDIIEAIRLFLAANAALCTFLIWLFLRKSGLSILDTLLCVSLFITSSGFLFWLTVPETYAFACTSILASLHILFLKKNENHRTILFETLLCAASLTITITNWSVGIVAVFVRHRLVEWPLSLTFAWMSKPWACWWEKIRLPLLIVMLAFGIVLVLAFVQNLLFDRASLFINVNYLLSESRFIPGRSIVELPSRIFELVVGPIVAGNVYITNPLAKDGAIVFVEMSNTANLDNLAWFVTVAWICVLVVSLLTIYSMKHKDEGVLTVFISLLGFLLLYFIYGGIYFLYSANFLPLLVLLASFGLRGNLKNLGRSALFIVICAGFYNNFHELQNSIAILGS